MIRECPAPDQIGDPPVPDEFRGGHESPVLTGRDERGLEMSAGGLSEARLRRMGDVMAGHVERGVPGLVWLVSRRGEVHAEALGSATLASVEHDAVPMRRDTIFRFAS